MSGRTIGALLAALVAVVIAVVVLVGGSGDNDDGDSAAPASSPDPTETTPSDPTSTTIAAGDEEQPACGATLADIQALLPPDSGVTENSTPDPGRCNFTWDDDGPRGIDMATVPGGRMDFEVPSGYEPIEGYGDEAFVAIDAGRVSAVAFVGDDLHAADVVADSTGATEAQLRNLCLQVLELTLS